MRPLPRAESRLQREPHRFALHSVREKWKNASVRTNSAAERIRRVRGLQWKRVCPKTIEAAMLTAERRPRKRKRLANDDHRDPHELISSGPGHTVSPRVWGRGNENHVVQVLHPPFSLSCRPTGIGAVSAQSPPSFWLPARQ